MRRFAQAALLAAAVLPFALPAQAANDGYWTSRYGTIITSSKTGKCFKTRYWTPSNATAACKEKAEMSAMKK